jgi:hypothetical protein
MAQYVCFFNQSGRAEGNGVSNGRGVPQGNEDAHERTRASENMDQSRFRHRECCFQSKCTTPCGPTPSKIQKRKVGSLQYNNVYISVLFFILFFFNFF